MAVQVSLIVFAIGALLRFATTVSSSSFNLHAVGVVLMVAGAAGIVVSAWNLTLADPPVRIKLKLPAYLRDWLQKRHTSPRWLSRKARAWSNRTGDWEAKRRHHSNVYVFALTAHREARTLDPRDVSQWRFFVVPTWKIDRRRRKKISEPMLTSMAKEVRYTELPDAVRRAAEPEKEVRNDER